VLKELWDDYPTMMERDVRTVLGNFLFSGDDVLKPVSSLSGGEKARLALAKLMLQRANLLILDEPTNHLDIDSKEVLEAALIDYPGTIVFVSHDRYFINRIADQVVELTKEGTTVYLGDYDYYVEKKEETAEIKRLDELEKAAPKKEEKKNEQALSFKEQKQLQSEKRKIARRITELEEKIEILEAEHAEIEEQMTLPEVFEDHEAVMKLTEQTATIRSQIDKYMEEWTELSEEE